MSRDKTVLILGAGGLIGHKLFEKLPTMIDRVHCTLHGESDHALFQNERVINNIDVLDEAALADVLARVNPDVVLNCVGITKRKEEINDLEYSISVNSVFPHRLANWAGANGKRVIHFSTDCVFDGEIGDYTEDSKTTGFDNYGKTKALGEIRYPHTLTIRSSFIGRELSGKTELLEWAIGSRGNKIRGFSKAFYSGVSTIQMAKTVGQIITDFPELSGLLQLSVEEPINKFDLLQIANTSFDLGLTIDEDTSFATRPTLDGSKLRQAMDLELPSWPQMMDELAEDRLYD